MTIKISSTSEALDIKDNYDAVISIESPLSSEVLRFHTVPHPDHLVLRFEDVDLPHNDIALPDPVHVKKVLEFGRRYRDRKLLIHCQDGLSCSAAIALGLIADAFGQGLEEEAIRELLRMQPDAMLNLLLLEFIESELDRDGELEMAWRMIELSDDQYEARLRVKEDLIEQERDSFSEPLDIADTILTFKPYSIEPTKRLNEEDTNLFRKEFK